jgi:mannan endo-1,4-beta-mannosidase
MLRGALYSLVAVILLTPSGSGAAPGLHTKGRHLYTACHEKVVLVGVNRMFTWCDRQGSSIAEIAKSGANCVRIVALPSDSASDVDLWIQKTINHGMIPIPELHGATGDLGKLSSMVDWWVSASVVAMMKKHEKYVILNIANESGDCSVGVNEFVSSYKTAISRIRKTGLKVPIMIDGPCWAHDTDSLQTAAPVLQQADPEGNLIFANHYYGKNASGVSIGFGGEAAHIKKETAEWVAVGLPFVWGEFGYCSTPIDVKTLIAVANQNEVGWIAWSWGPGNQGCPGMDMSSDGTFAALKGWGLEVAVSDPNSIKNTAKRPASLMNKGVCPTAPTSDLGLQPASDAGVPGDAGGVGPSGDAGGQDSGASGADAGGAEDAAGESSSANNDRLRGGCTAAPTDPSVAPLPLAALLLLLLLAWLGRASLE